MRSVVERFQLIQLGLCFFVADGEKSKASVGGAAHYSAYPYNMYLFPEERVGGRTDIVIDIDTANFHKQQKLDFNKWIYEGVPYLNERAEKSLTSRAMEERNEEIEELKLNDEDAKRLGLILENIKKWVQDGAKSEYIIADLNPFLRKYMYQKIRVLYPGMYTESKLVGKYEKNIVLKMMTESEKQAIKEAKRQEDLKEIHRKTGARRLFNLLSSLKVPIVGHNPTYDLLFLYSHLQDELPRSLVAFKTQIHTLFPTVYDTMLVFADEKVKRLLPERQSSALEAVYLFLSRSTEMANVTVSVDLDKSKYSDSNHYHEAGYDAYITGYCFAKMLGYVKPEDLGRYKNKLYTHRSPFSITLTGKEDLNEHVCTLSPHEQ